MKIHAKMTVQYSSRQSIRVGESFSLTAFNDAVLHRSERVQKSLPRHASIRCRSDIQEGFLHESEIDCCSLFVLRGLLLMGCGGTRRCASIPVGCIKSIVCQFNPDEPVGRTHELAPRSVTSTLVGFTSFRLLFHSIRKKWGKNHTSICPNGSSKSLPCT